MNVNGSDGVTPLSVEERPSTAALGSSPSATVGGHSTTTRRTALSQSTNVQKALAFARCMRSHGVRNWPDPSSSGVFAKRTPQQLGVSDSQYQAAQNACQNLLPAGANDQFPPAEVQQLLVGMRSFSQCMRSHGVTNWPDPSTDSQGQPQFDITSAGITSSDRRSPQVQTAMSTCQHLLPSALGPGDPPLN